MALTHAIKTGACMIKYTENLYLKSVASLAWGTYWSKISTSAFILHDIDCGPANGVYVDLHKQHDFNPLCFRTPCDKLFSDSAIAMFLGKWHDVVYLGFISKKVGSTVRCPRFSYSLDVQACLSINLYMANKFVLIIINNYCHCILCDRLI